jgi:LPXTG-motif cell wall-anchored protein
VGPIVGLALLSGLLWFFLRRRIQKAGINASGTASGNTGYDAEYKGIPQMENEDAKKSHRTSELPGDNALQNRTSELPGSPGQQHVYEMGDHR